ncbi:CPBP family intramembrane glutamic endopeptidase [Streptococcus halotolerans]
MLKKTSIYLFPVFIYIVFHNILAQIQLYWWKQRNFDDNFYLLVNAILLLNILIICLWQSTRFNSKPFRIFGAKWWYAPITFCLGSTIFIFDLTSSRLFSIPLTENTNSLNTILSYSNGNFFLQGFILWNVILGPIREEIFNRMLLMETYFKESPYYFDVLLSAIVFSASHVLPSGNFQAFWVYAIPGTLYALMYRFTRTIYCPILVHILWNGYVYWDLINLVIT